jgi:hypothetical protein
MFTLNFLLSSPYLPVPIPIKAMSDTNAASTLSTDASIERPPGNCPKYDTLRDSVAHLSSRVRDTAGDAGLFVSDQLAEAVKVAAELRDRTLSEKSLAEARDLPILKSLRRTAHTVLDIGFDLGAVAVHVGFEGADRLLRRSERTSATKAD